MTTTPSTRKSAEQRREEIVAIGIAHFGRGGYHGTSTEAIARDAGISQPYLFRLFGTKRDLFIACNESVLLRIRTAFERAAAEPSTTQSTLERMGESYMELLGDREALLFQLQSYAASDDPVLQAHVRQGFGELVALAAQLSGAEDHEIFQFFSTGMLINVIASLDLAAVAPDDPWAAAWCEPKGLLSLSRHAQRADAGGAPSAA